MALDPRPPAWTAWGIIFAVVTIPVTISTAAAVPEITLAGALLLLLLEVVVVALLSNLVVSVLAALGAVAGANYYLTGPYHTFLVADPADIIALTVFIVTAIAASLLITWVLRQREDAARSEAEARTYRNLMTAPNSENSPEPALRTIVDLLNLDEVELRDRANRRIAWVQTPHFDEHADRALLQEELPDGYLLLGSGRFLNAADERIVRSLGAAAVRSHQRAELISGGT